MTPTASVTGNLAKTPFSHLLVYCLDKSRTGTLVLEVPGGARHALFFECGTPAKVKTGESIARLGQVLCDMALVDERSCKAARDEAVRERVLHGEVLLRKGLLDRHDLRSALRAQILRKVEYLAALPETTPFAFYDETNLLDGFGAAELTPVDGLSAVASGVRAAPPWARVEATLGQLGELPLELHPDAEPARFRPNDIERRVVDALQAGGRALSALEALAPRDRPGVRAFVYTLLITRHAATSASGKGPVGVLVPPPSSSRISIGSPLARVQLKRAVVAAAPEPAAYDGDEPPLSLRDLAPPSASLPGRAAPAPLSRPAAPAPVAGPAGPAPVSAPVSTAGRAPVGRPAPVVPEPVDPPATSAEQLALAASLAAEAEGFESRDHFALLGVTPKAGPDDTKAAYFKLAKRWHPDRVPAAIPAARELASRVFARLGEAFRVLSDPALRASYEATLASGGGDDEESHVSRVVDASVDFQKAEIVFKRGDVTAAEGFVNQAIERDPSQPDYVAFAAWLRAHRPGVSRATIDEAVGALDALLEREPKNQRARWYRGNLLKRVGRPERAVLDFKSLVEINPQHVDAQRELRLHEMRTSSADRPAVSERSAAARSTSGLFGKLFKK